ncbi:hypothetical protein FLP10_06850 [Agromyces intestinalis]|uniref:Polysaccharide pyruvyl transferase domain-containing protein n=1 Tax=Agromyces intestinalis TaxID=2592652 RepID=A0A5C1YGL4_9MICO|nr:polysaccharide pyruvyl transferase family protein [Agromyces intestinalis]QEO14167.1 hypothetical protein FLP10_06850 [Agromyces intestinalis]
MNPSRLVRRARARAEEIVAASAIAARRDRARIARAVQRAQAGAAGAPGVSNRSDAAGSAPHLLLASAGAGNIGDQAMLDAFVERVDGPVVVVIRRIGDFAMPPGADDRVSFVPLGELIYGGGFGGGGFGGGRLGGGRLGGDVRGAELEAFGALLATARSCSVIGADVMDGRYSPRGSVRRATLAEAAVRAGVPSRILGFSWNAHPHRRARAALRRAGAAGVVSLVRDPVSAARARIDDIPGVVDTADLVFAARDVDPGAATRLLGPEDGPVVLVNASALVGRDHDQVGEYRRIVNALRAGGDRVLLVPHVSRPSSDDVAACRAVFEAVGDDPGVGLVDRLLTPAEIRGLAARARLVVTGRMHLAIMALRAGVPAITLATQGKVEGLMRLVGVPELCVEPGPDLGERVLAVARRLESDPAARTRIRVAHDRLRTLAQRNTIGLPLPAAPVAAPVTFADLAPTAPPSSPTDPRAVPA